MKNVSNSYNYQYYENNIGSLTLKIVKKEKNVLNVLKNEHINFLIIIEIKSYVKQSGQIGTKYNSQ